MTEEEFLIEMKNFFENIDKLKARLEGEIKRVELERNDLLHELELGKLNAVELTKVAVVLRDVLKERRQYKDELKKSNDLKRIYRQIQQQAYSWRHNSSVKESKNTREKQSRQNI